MRKLLISSMMLPAVLAARACGGNRIIGAHRKRALMIISAHQ